MEAIAGEINIVGDDHARVLRKSRQRGRSHRGVRGRSANGSLNQLLAARVIENLWIRKVPNQSNCGIKTRHVRGGNNRVSAQVHNCGRPASITIEHEHIPIVGIERRFQAIKMGRSYPSICRSISNPRDRATEDRIGIALALSGRGERVVVGRQVNVSVVQFSARRQSTG